jgi:hypothetical protein
VWDWAVWSALAVAICSGTAGVALFAMRALEAFRALRALSSRATWLLGELSAKTAPTATKAETAGDTRELEETIARLRGSLAQLAILKAALERADRELGWVRVLL